MLFSALCDLMSQPTSKVSHDGSWRAACNTKIYFTWFHFEAHSAARGVTVTDPGVGSR